MKPKTSTPAHPKDGDYAWEDFGKRVGWDSRGSFVTESAGIHQNTTNFVLAMIRRRRAGSPTPANVAMEAGVHGVCSAFPSVDEWSGLDRVAHWPLAGAASSAEEAVKRAARPVTGPVRQQPGAADAAFGAAREVVSLCDRRGLDGGRNPVRIRLYALAGEVVSKGGTAADAAKVVEQQLVELYGEWVEVSPTGEDLVPLE